MNKFATFFSHLYLFDLEKLNIKNSNANEAFFMVIGIIYCIIFFVCFCRTLVMILNEDIKNYKLKTFLSLFLADATFYLFHIFISVNLSWLIHPVGASIFYFISLFIIFGISSESEKESIFGIGLSIIKYFSKKDKKLEKIKNYNTEYKHYLEVDYEKFTPYEI